MCSFILALLLLVLGYFLYGRLVEKLCGVDPARPTPAQLHSDGVDYVPMKPWRVFLIQFLNIAGLGPIFGAIMGAHFGTSSFLWIVFGCIFGGAVHDFVSGMMSLRNNGANLPTLHEKYLGKSFGVVSRVFIMILMMLVGVVFLVGPADILGGMTGPTHPIMGSTFWIVVIFGYYILATLLPIDKIIGRIYPLFGVCLLVMAVGVGGYLLMKHPVLPEVWDGLQNRHPAAESNPIFPMMFISIACGAVSGFHASQSPMMARCLTSERQARPIFYGAMITEGVVALIWAAAASVFFFSGDYNQEAATFGSSAPKIVKFLTETWLGRIGSILAMLGVVFAPVSTGDTAFRTARLILADILHFDQKPVRNRLLITIPMFVVAFFILVWDLKSPDGFNIIWNYFSWANQVLAAFTLWAVTVYLVQLHPGKFWFAISFIPAVFMSYVCLTFILYAKIGLNLSLTLSYLLAMVLVLALAVSFLVWCCRRKDTETTCNL